MFKDMTDIGYLLGKKTKPKSIQIGSKDSADKKDSIYLDKEGNNYVVSRIRWPKKGSNDQPVRKLCKTFKTKGPATAVYKRQK